MTGENLHSKGAIAMELAFRDKAIEQMQRPIPMILYCPECGEKHVDKAEPEKDWLDPPHRSHLCSSCKFVWRPCDLSTTGVESIETRGAADHLFRIRGRRQQ